MLSKRYETTELDRKTMGTHGVGKLGRADRA